MKKIFLALALALAPAAAFADANSGATQIQQTATMNNAATLVATSASTGVTLTLTCPSSTFAYVTAVEISNCAGGTAVTAATPTSVTTTNLGGAAWTVGSGVTAGLCQPSPVAPYGFPLKSQTNAPTVVLPAFATNQTIRVSVYYFCAQ